MDFIVVTYFNPKCFILLESLLATPSKSFNLLSLDINDWNNPFNII